MLLVGVRTKISSINRHHWLSWSTGRKHPISNVRRGWRCCSNHCPCYLTPANHQSCYPAEPKMWVNTSSSVRQTAAPKDGRAAPAPWADTAKGCRAPPSVQPSDGSWESFYFAGGNLRIGQMQKKMLCLQTKVFIHLLKNEQATLTV